MSALAQASDSEIWEEFKQSFPFHMAVLNFLYFVSGEAYAHVVPTGMRTVAEEIYLAPLRAAQGRVKASLASGGELHKSLGEGDASMALSEVELMGQRLEMCVV
jgi:hypothetical protein